MSLSEMTTEELEVFARLEIYESHPNEVLRHFGILAGVARIELERREKLYHAKD